MHGEGRHTQVPLAYRTRLDAAHHSHLVGCQGAGFGCKALDIGAALVPAGGRAARPDPDP